MARRIQALLTDDLGGGEAHGTVRLGLDGTEYETGLSAAHSGELREARERCPGGTAAGLPEMTGHSPGHLPPGTRDLSRPR